MADYHVGCGFAGIYAGTLNKKNDTWINKSEVTNEAMCAVAQYIIEHNEGMSFSYHGQRYKLQVVQLQDGE